MAGAQIIIVRSVNLSDGGSSECLGYMDRDGDEILIVALGTGTRDEIPLMVLGTGTGDVDVGNEIPMRGTDTGDQIPIVVPGTVIW
mmetsp:Transcript_6503/g.7946  ORF Transcript_6503/g.7946 Transcript_6503/m.7946 type:complete len:86 (-) Transcript_6503:580-837(-)